MNQFCMIRIVFFSCLYVHAVSLKLQNQDWQMAYKFSKAHDTVNLYALHYKTPHLARLQGLSLIRFLKQPAMVYFVSSSCDEADQKELDQVSTELNGILTNLKETRDQWPIKFSVVRFSKYSFRGDSSTCDARDLSKKEGTIYNWCFHQHLAEQAQKPTYIGFLHSDFFLVNAFDARPYLDARGIYGSPAVYSDGKKWHPHPQMLFMRLDRWDPKKLSSLSFFPQLGMDTGGGIASHLGLGEPKYWLIPKRYVEMFGYATSNGLIPPCDEASAAIRQGNGEMGTQWDVACQTMQCEGYEVFDDAWVHSRHSKLLVVTIPGSDVTPYIKSHPEWAHVKNAYIKGLIEGRLQDQVGVGGLEMLDVPTKPSGSVMEPLELTSTGIQKTGDKLLNALGSDCVNLLVPDNAYMKGWLDASLIYNGTRQDWPDCDGTGPSHSPCGESHYINTRPSV